MVLTGFMIFWPMREFLLSRTQFYVKMAFVLTLFINSFVIGKLQVIATKRTFASLTPQEKVPLFLSGAVSTTCWILTIVAAFFLIPE
jgi:small-conductance mechanosensitive channel